MIKCMQTEKYAQGNMYDEHGKVHKPNTVKTTCTWAILTKGTKYLIAIQLIGDHGSG
jgi:hypothetical protein